MLSIISESMSKTNIERGYSSHSMQNTCQIKINLQGISPANVVASSSMILFSSNAIFFDKKSVSMIWMLSIFRLEQPLMIRANKVTSDVSSSSNSFCRVGPLDSSMKHFLSCRSIRIRPDGLLP